MTDFPFPDRTFGQFLQQFAAQRPQHTALIDGQSGQRLTYAALAGTIGGVADQLRRRGVEGGDAVYLVMQKRMELPLAILACARVGAVAVPVPAPLFSERVTQLRDLLPPKLLLHGAEFDGAAHLQREGLAIGNLDLSQWESWTIPDAPVEDDPDRVCYANLTSGTTGEPKVVMTTHRMLAANTFACIEHFGLTGNDVHLCAFSAAAHPHEHFCRGLMTGGTSVLLETVFPKTLAKTVAAFGVTHLMGVTSVYELLVQFCEHAGVRLPDLKVAEIGGMPTPENLASQWQRVFGFAPTPVWGSTETTGVAVATPPGQYVPGSVGVPIPGYRAVLRGDDGQPVREGEPGGLTLSGPGVTDGYLNGATFPDGFPTGDTFVLREGVYHHLGRADGMMKVSGNKVYPQEIEAVLMEHPAVDEAAIVPMEDPLHGVLPRAFVVLTPGEQSGAEHIREYLMKVLPSHKVPRQVHLHKALPRNAMGKVDRRRLESEAVESVEETLESVRTRIQRIDLRLLSLLNERAELVRRIHEVKRRHKLPVFDPLREEQLLEVLRGHNSGPLYDNTIEEIFRLIMTSTYTLDREGDA